MCGVCKLSHVPGLFLSGCYCFLPRTEIIHIRLGVKSKVLLALSEWQWLSVSCVSVSPAIDWRPVEVIHWCSKVCESFM